MYATDNRGYFPHIDGRDRQDDRLPPNPGAADLADWWCGWVDVLPPLGGYRPWRDYRMGEKPGAGTFFQCPSADLGSRPDRKSRELRGFFSYAMNSCLELDENCYRLEGVKPMPGFLATDLIVQPSRVVLLFDQLLDPSRGYGGSERNRSAGEHCGSYPKDFAVRHARRGADRGGSILYCDYSVRWIETVWKDHWPDHMKCPPRNDPDWFPYPQKNN